VPVLPVRLWQDGAFLFAAATPADPDHHLRLLEMAATAHWQWLPLVGPDFPLASFAQRGPLIAWTPHLAGVAVRLERDRPAPLPARATRVRGGRLWVAALLLCIAVLLGGNLWYMRQVNNTLAAVPTPPEPASVAKPKEERPGKSTVRPGMEVDESRERLARALHRLLSDRGGAREMKDDRVVLLERYDDLVRRYPDLAVRADNEEGKLAIAAASMLAGRSSGRIDEAIRKALEGKGFSDDIVHLAREHVRKQLAAEAKER
jgi:hypothetical protein